MEASGPADARLRCSVSPAYVPPADFTIGCTRSEACTRTWLRRRRFSASTRPVLSGRQRGGRAVSAEGKRHRYSGGSGAEWRRCLDSPAADAAGRRINGAHVAIARVG